jgi:hypothetical protein
VASWIKLLVIMHADKIGAKKKNLSWWILKFWLEPFVFLEIHRRSPHHKPSKDIPQNQSLKWIQRTMKKVILNLQWVISVFKIQDNQRTILNSVCWVFDQKAWFSKDLFQNWYLFDFISTIRLELTWSLKYESWFQNKKDC